jgi:hypothetical protein
VEPGTPLLALRLGDFHHALELGREYLIGSADDCDLMIRGAEPVHARVSVTQEAVTISDLSSAAGILHNEERVSTATVQPGDRIAISDEFLIVTLDDGSATLVPIPELRNAATARRIVRVRSAAAQLRHHGAQTFSQMMAAEMRRTPWVMLSLMLHLMLLLLFWWFTPARVISGDSIATIALDARTNAITGDGPPSIPQVTTEPDDDVIIEDVVHEVAEQPVPVVEGPRPMPTDLAASQVLAKRRRSSTAGAGDQANDNNNGIGSGSFKKEVEALQESGLEIVFVFDSTGSMTRTIMDTKESIVQMLDVLHTLVPDARVGLVTYRDRGRREEYLTRQVPLDVDYWRANNFMQFVVAEGGGDRPEDVRAGLRAAFNQRWRNSARRVVVLAGDAPTHEEDVSKTLREVRKFTKNRRSFVHTLITSPNRAGEDTILQFQKIAAAGRGVCEPIDNRDRVLQRVLTLAFGSQYSQDLRRVVQSIEQDRTRADVASLHLVRKGGQPLIDALKQRPVSTLLWNALVRRPRQHVAQSLLDLLDDSRTPTHTRHACAAAIQRILKLAVPPIDPGSNAPPSKHYVARLRSLIKQLPE